MKTFDLTFAAGETKTLPSGVFLALALTVSPVNIKYFVRGVNINENAVNVESGYFYETLDDGFDTVQITSQLAQTIKVGISSGRGGFNIITSTKIISGSLTPDTLNGKYFRESASSFLNTIVTPAANVNGIKVINAGVSGNFKSYSSIMAKTSAPSGTTDLNAHRILSVFGLDAQNVVAQLQRPVLIPVGYGLYEQQSGSLINQAYINYELF